MHIQQVTFGKDGRICFADWVYPNKNSQYNWPVLFNDKGPAVSLYENGKLIAVMYYLGGLPMSEEDWRAELNSQNYISVSN